MAVLMIKDEYIRHAMNRPALGSFPPAKFAEWLETGLMTVAPKGLDQLMTTLCGSSANGMSVLCFPGGTSAGRGDSTEVRCGWGRGVICGVGWAGGSEWS